MYRVARYNVFQAFISVKYFNYYYHHYLFAQQYTHIQNTFEYMLQYPNFVSKNFVHFMLKLISTF